MPRTSDPGTSVSSRLLSVLFAFSTTRRTLSIADLARITGLPYPTTRRFVNELVAVGALERRDDDRYAVGVRLWQLASLSPRTEGLRSLAQPVLEDLYTALHQHVQLAVLQGDHAVVVERRSAPDAVRLVSRVGGRLPLHASAVGKVLLAHASRDIRDRVLGEPPRYTPHTIVDPDALREELAVTRRTGTATVREELTPGADSVATRVVDGDGRVVAALSVVVRAGSVRLEAATPTTVASGLRLSRLLGWHPGITVLDG